MENKSGSPDGTSSLANVVQRIRDLLAKVRQAHKVTALIYAQASTICELRKCGNHHSRLGSLHADGRHSRHSTAKSLGSVRVWFGCQLCGLRVGLSHTVCQEARLHLLVLQSVGNLRTAVEACHSHLRTGHKKNEPVCLNISHALTIFAYDSIAALVMLYAYVCPVLFHSGCLVTCLLPRILGQRGFDNSRAGPASLSGNALRLLRTPQRLGWGSSLCWAAC